MSLKPVDVLGPLVAGVFVGTCWSVIGKLNHIVKALEILAGVAK